MARDRKRAKQRQRRAAQRQPQPARAARAEPQKPKPKPEAEPEELEGVPADGPDADHTIADLEHGSAGADIAKASIAAGSVDADEVSEELDTEMADHRAGEVFADELGDDGDDGTEAASAAVGRPARRERARRERGGGNRLTTFLRNSWEELKRVQWPDRRQVAQATAVVIGFVIIIGLYLGAADYIFGKLVDAII